MNNHSQAIERSVRTNKQKALDNENNKRAIALIRSMNNEGRSFAYMAQYLNEQGFRTSRGCKFQITQVKRLHQKLELVS